MPSGIPDGGSMVGSWNRCGTDQVITSPQWLTGFNHIWDEKGVWEAHVTWL